MLFRSILGIPRGARLGYFSHKGEDIPLWKLTDPNTERLIRVLGGSAVAENALAGTLTPDNAIELAVKAMFSQQLNRSAATLKPFIDEGWIQKFSRRGNEITPELNMTDRIVGHVPGMGALQGAFGDDLDPRRPLKDRITAGLLKGMYGGPSMKTQRDTPVQVGAMAAADHLDSDAMMNIATKIKRANLHPTKWRDAAIKEVGGDVNNIQSLTREQREQIDDILGKLNATTENNLERTVKVLMERKK